MQQSARTLSVFDRRQLLVGGAALGATMALPATADALETPNGTLRRTIVARMLLPEGDIPAEIIDSRMTYQLVRGGVGREITPQSPEYETMRTHINTFASRDEVTIARSRTAYAEDGVPEEFWSHPELFYQHGPASVMKQLHFYCAANVLKSGAISEGETVRYSNDAYSIPAVGLSWYKRRNRYRHLRANRIVGRRIRTGDLVESMVGASANDAAFLLAQRLGRAIIESDQFDIDESQARSFARDELGMSSLAADEVSSAAYILYMRRTAAELKMRNTTVVSVNGLPTEQMYLGSSRRRFSASLSNVTCAYDLMLLNQAMVERHSDFMERFGRQGAVTISAEDLAAEAQPLTPDDVATDQPSEVQAFDNAAEGTSGAPERRTMYDMFIKTGFTILNGYCLSRLSHFPQRIREFVQVADAGADPLSGPAAEPTASVRTCTRKACLIVLDAASRDQRDDISDDFTAEIGRLQARTVQRQPSINADVLAAS